MPLPAAITVVAAAFPEVGEVAAAVAVGVGVGDLLFEFCFRLFLLLIATCSICDGDCACKGNDGSASVSCFVRLLVNCGDLLPPRPDFLLELLFVLAGCATLLLLTFNVILSLGLSLSLSHTQARAYRWSLTRHFRLLQSRPGNLLLVRFVHTQLTEIKRIDKKTRRQYNYKLVALYSLLDKGAHFWLASDARLVVVETN